MLCTLLPISDGTATVAGVDVRRDPAEVRRRIGVALQEVGLDTTQTGRELLDLQCGLYKVPDPAARTTELLELVGLTEAGDRLVRAYSGGMKRRLDLATALVHAPEVLFLDEPTTGLDPASRVTIWDEVRRINASGTTVFLTTQYLEEADQLCERSRSSTRGRSWPRHAGRVEVRAGQRRGHRRPRCQPSRDRSVGARAGAEPGPHHRRRRRSGRLRRRRGRCRPGHRAVAQRGRHPPRAITLSRPSLDDVFLAATGRRIEGGAPTPAETAGAR